MANEIIELRRTAIPKPNTGNTVYRVDTLMLFPIAAPEPGVVPTPSAGLSERELAVLDPTEVAGLDAGTLAYERVTVTDRTSIAPDMERRNRAYQAGGRTRSGLRTRLSDETAEAAKQAEEDALAADPAAAWVAGLQRVYAGKSAAFAQEYAAQYRPLTPTRVSAGGAR